jgi:hypothetical protein
VIRRDAAALQALATPLLPYFKRRKSSDPIQLIFKPYQKFVRKASKSAVLRPLQLVGSSSDKYPSLWIITGSTPLSAPIGRERDRSRLCLHGRAQNDFALMNEHTSEMRSGKWQRRGLTTIQSPKSYPAMMMMMMMILIAFLDIILIGRPMTNDDQ